MLLEKSKHAIPLAGFAASIFLKVWATNSEWMKMSLDRWCCIEGVVYFNYKVFSFTNRELLYYTHTHFNTRGQEVGLCSAKWMNLMRIPAVWGCAPCLEPSKAPPRAPRRSLIMILFCWLLMSQEEITIGNMWVRFQPANQTGKVEVVDASSHITPTSSLHQADVEEENTVFPGDFSSRNTPGLSATNKFSSLDGENLRLQPNRWKIENEVGDFVIVMLISARRRPE